MAFLAFSLAVSCACSPQRDASDDPPPLEDGLKEGPESSAVVRYMAHGGFFADGGIPVEPSLSVIANTQRYQLRTLLPDEPVPTYPPEVDAVLMRAMRIQELLEDAEGHFVPSFKQVNASLIAYYARRHAPESRPQVQTLAQALATNATWGRLQGTMQTRGCPCA